jgi:hypothetical protein
VNDAKFTIVGMSANPDVANRSAVNSVSNQ